jgi:hypothetical protein
LRLTPTTTVAALSVVALGGALTLTGGATAAQEDRATGGGQIEIGTGGGAGDTIAFTARGAGDEARGQVQYVNREEGKGRSQTVQHGTVNCLYVDHDTARIAGKWRDGGPFYLYVKDNGEGSSAENDIVALTSMSDGECADDPQDDPRWALARGNAQVHDADASE